MEQSICNWTPQLTVELIKAVVWPFTILIIGIGFKFHLNIYKALKNLFSESKISEFSITPSGISAKLVAEKQASEPKDLTDVNSAIKLPESKNKDAILKHIEKNKTEFSEECYKGIKLHLAALNLTSEEQIDMLAKEVSLLQSFIKYSDINKVIFRSQFNLILRMSTNSGYMAKDEVERQFAAIQESNKEVFSNWDWIKYVSYLVTTGLISDEGSGYKLTVMGNSYITFMRRNTHLVDEISKL